MLPVSDVLVGAGACVVVWWLVTVLSRDSVFRFLERLTRARDLKREIVARATARLCGAVVVDTPDGEVVLWSRDRRGLAGLAGLLARNGNRRHGRGNELAAAGERLSRPVFMAKTPVACENYHAEHVSRWWRGSDGRPVLVDEIGGRQIEDGTFALFRQSASKITPEQRAALLAQLSAVVESSFAAPAVEAPAPAGSGQDAPVGGFIDVPDELRPIIGGRNGTAVADATWADECETTQKPTGEEFERGESPASPTGT